MSAFRDDGTLVWSFADDTGERDALKQLIVIVILVILRRLAALALGRHRPSSEFLALGPDLPLAVEFPSLLVVLARVEELTGIPKATEPRGLVTVRFSD